MPLTITPDEAKARFGELLAGDLANIASFPECAPAVSISGRDV